MPPQYLRILLRGGPGPNLRGLFPVIGSNLHPVYPYEFQPVLLGKLDGLKRPPLSELLTANILRLEVQAVQNWFPEQNEQVPVRL